MASDVDSDQYASRALEMESRFHLRELGLHSNGRREGRLGADVGGALRLRCRLCRWGLPLVGKGLGYLCVLRGCRLLWRRTTRGAGRFQSAFAASSSDSLPPLRPDQGSFFRADLLFLLLLPRSRLQRLADVGGGRVRLPRKGLDRAQDVSAKRPEDLTSGRRGGCRGGRTLRFGRTAGRLSYELHEHARHHRKTPGARRDGLGSRAQLGSRAPASGLRSGGGR